MPDVLEAARSGRARCRGCREKIEKGALRFGEAVDNPYGEGEATHWFHLPCGADKRPEKFAAALAVSEVEVPDRSSLEAVARAGAANPNLARVRAAERAPTGRARCRECREMIEKAALRVIVDVEEEGMTMPTKYFVHAACAVAHLGSEGLLDKLRRASATLESADLDELGAALK